MKERGSDTNSILTEISKLREEVVKTTNSSTLQETNSQKSSDHKDTKSIYFELNSIYAVHAHTLEKYLLNKFNLGYAKAVINSLRKIFVTHNANSINEIKRLYEEKIISAKSCTVSFRVFLNYIEENDLLDITIIEKYRRLIKVNNKCGVDRYIPTTEEMKNSIEVLKTTTPKEVYLFYLFVLQTSCRYTEAEHFFLNFNKKYLEIKGEICIYSNFYIRGKKSSYYLLFTKKLYDQIENIIKGYTKEKINYILGKVQREQNIINVKYLRKYTFTLMIMNEISIEIANLISGRSQQNNVGITHYLNQKEIMAKEYQKIVQKLLELM